MTKFVNLLGAGLLAVLLMGCTELMGILGQPTTPETKKQETVLTPYFSTPSGARTAKFDLKIAPQTQDSDIWYTLDGTVPAAGKGTSVKYSAAISIYKDMTIKAIAVKKDWKDSAVVEVAFTFEPVPLRSIALDTSTVNFAGTATMPKLAMAYTGTGWTKIRYTFWSDSTLGGLPYVIVDNAPTTGNQISLNVNKYFTNAKWTLKKIEMTGSTSQDIYEAAQSGSDTPPLPVWKY